MTTSSTKTVFTIAGYAFLLPCLFFIYYTIRLLYVNLMLEDAAAHRTGGMLIGAIAFPFAAIIFGLLCRFYLNKARKGITQQ
ncbi:MAG: hypothetical protein DMF62_03370 [Acidobacteria bacterium]|nr:MAG: hypothetical protein DMF62_03370 [Acidobacteriota bacterium]